MIYHEALPLAGGAILGCIARYAYHRTHRWSYVAVILVIALCATMASGEFRQSWAFLFDDILIVSLSACAAFLLSGVIASRLLQERAGEGSSHR
jgi:general stress protein CsbA